MRKTLQIWRYVRGGWVLAVAALWLAAAIPLFSIAKGFVPLVLTDDPVVRAEALVAEAGTEGFEREIAAALEEQDATLAAELVTLADERGIPLNAWLLFEVRKANAFDLARGAENVFRGVVFGEMLSPAGTVAAVASDLTSIGDVRDLIREGSRYPDYDPLVVALAGTGLALTIGTVVSGGTSVAITGPAKLGTGLLKVARRTGKMTARLSGDLTRLARRAIDTDALQAVYRSARKLDYTSARRSAATVIRRTEGKALTETASTLGAIATDQGPRAALASLSVADSTMELNALRRVAQRFDGSYRAVLRIAPDAAKGLTRASKLTWRLGETGALLIGWLLGVLALAASLIRMVFRLSVRVGGGAVGRLLT